MTNIQTHVQVFIRGKWKHSKEPRWVIQEDLCKNFPLCNKKLPSHKSLAPRFQYKGYCSKICYEKYVDKGSLIQQKLNDFLKNNGGYSHD